MGRRTLIRTVGLVALCVAFASGYELHARSVAHSSAPPPPSVNGPHALRRAVLADLEHHYYRALPPAALHAHWVSGMVAALHDPYTEYLPPALYQDLVDIEDGGYSGVGVALTHGHRGLIVTASLPGLPASKAGIQPGDVIVSIDGTALSGLSYADAVLMMHGNPGTSVRLAVRRQGVDHPLVLTLVRQPVEVRAVSSRVMTFQGHRYLYVRVPGFVDHTAEHVRSIVEKAHDHGIDRVVLDLRGNLGGLLSQAVAVSQVFVNQGVIVETSGRRGHTALYTANDTAVSGLKVAVLVDGITASAAEVVAGSLQRAHAAVVVGTRTYGKGTVQSVWPVPGGGALKLTVAVFRLAGGVQVNGRGVRPDVDSSDRPTTPADETLEAALATLARG